MLSVVIVTISDRSARGEREDLSGPALAEVIRQQGWQVAAMQVVSDDVSQITATLIALADSAGADVILTTGGTGFAPRDVTPEATRQVLERLTPGLDEAMRATSLQVTKHAMLSRAISGIRKKSVIINLPGSPRGAVENLRVILPVLPHAVALLRDEPGSEAGHGTA